MNYRLILLCLFVSSAGKIFAQPGFNYAEIKRKFPTEEIYFLSNKKSIIIELNDSKLDLNSHNESSILYLSDKASLYSAKSIYYYEETEGVYNIQAASYVPDDKDKYKKTEVREIYSQKPLKNNIFYDDYKEFYFRFPGLKNKAVTTLTYSQKFKDPHFLDAFFFADYSPVENAEFSVTYPKEVKVNYMLAGDTTGIQFQRTETKKNTTLTWTAKNIKAFSGDYSSYNIRRVLPHVIVYIDEYTVNGKTTKVLSSVSELYNWYYGHIKYLVKDPEIAVKVLADSLTQGVQDPQEKMKKIYYWVQENIKYIAFEQGLGGFVPRPAELVCSRRYGDCKDKSSLLYALLKAAGLKSYFTWVGTRDIPYTYDQISSPVVDNHMIVSVRDDKGGWSFLDGTSSHLPIGFPSYPIQGKEALISVSPDSFLIVKIPEVNKERNRWVDSVSFVLNGSDMDGKGSTYLTGLMRSHMLNMYFDEAASKKDDEVKKLFVFGNNKCKTEMVGYRGDEGCEDTAFCSYKYFLPGYANSVGGKKFINMHLAKDLHGDQIDTAVLKSDRSYYLKSVHSRVFTMDIPANYKLVSVPPDASWNKDQFGFTFKYRVLPGKVILETQVYINTLTLPATEFTTWNEMVDTAENAYTEVVTLEEKQK